MKKVTLDEINNAMGQTRVITITHPRRPGYAQIVLKYPRDGAGRLQAWCIDRFTVPSDVQYGRAGGCGYDKQTAALSGMAIDGHTLTDHCAEDATSERLLKQWHAAHGDDARHVVEMRARKRGYLLTNWSVGGGYKPTSHDGWQSCYKISGLNYLQALGYNVITIG